MEIKNLTPHDVKVMMADGTERVFPPTGIVARVKGNPIPDGELDSIPCVRTIWGAVEGIPPQENDVYYIVSSLVLARLSNRDDCVAPDTSPTGAIRNDANQITAVRGFQRV